MSVSRVEIRAEQRRWRRGDVWVVLAALAFGTALAYILLSVQALNDDLRAANAARTALARQVERLGATPVVGPAGSQGEPGVSVTGPPGVDGVDGAPGAVGPSGPVGPSGKPGAVGATGPAGAAGAVGPVGPQGAQGPAGPQGERGEAGEQGERGERGPAGPSCPAGYSLQVPAWDPDVLVCRRDGGTDHDGDGGDSSPQALALDPQRRQYA
jgi:hypothetical protein